MQTPSSAPSPSSPTVEACGSDPQCSGFEYLGGYATHGRLAERQGAGLLNRGHDSHVVRWFDPSTFRTWMADRVGKVLGWKPVVAMQVVDRLESGANRAG